MDVDIDIPTIQELYLVAQRNSNFCVLATYMAI